MNGGGTGFQPVNVPQASPPASLPHEQDGHATSLSSRVIAEHPPVELVEKRDDHTRIWEIVREVETTHPDGSTTVDTVKSYIHEKASGLCYKDATGNYVPSVAEWRETPDGFVIDRCAYRLAMGKTIGIAARYTVEGNDLLLRPAYLIVSDGVSQTDPRPLTPETPGFISPDNPSVLRFPSAFGEGYDLEYVAEKGGFHQNLIISNPPQVPDSLDSATAFIHLYTELNLDQYLSACAYEVTVEGEPVNATAADLVTEPSRNGSISFIKDGRLLHAFSVSQVTDSSGPGRLDKQTTAEKRLMKNPASGKAYLIESVPFSYFTDNFRTYPITWDYQNITEPISGGTWEPKYTYRVSDNISIEGTLTILPGTTVKLDPSKKITIATNGKVIANGEPYNYITFTRTRDDNCGEIIYGPADQAYDRALKLLSASSGGSVVQYCKFGRGGVGVELSATLGEPIAHNIFKDMNFGLAVLYCCATAHNNLFSYCGYGIVTSSVPSGTYTNNTIDHSLTAIYDWNSSSLTVKDNLFTHCTQGIYTNNPYAVIINNGFFEVNGGQFGSPAVILTETPYEPPCGLGSYFLNDNVSGGRRLKDAGSRSALAAGLSDEVFTVAAPGAISPSPYTNQQIWSKIASEVVGSLVDIGYHHCRTDVYLPFDLTINDGETTEGSLTVKPGVVVGILGDSSIMATNGGTLLSVGNPDQGGVVRLTNSKSLSMNIESPQFGMPWSNPFLVVDSSASEQSSIQFTRTTWLGWGILINSGRYLTTPIQHNVFSLSYQGLHAGLNSGNSLLNNLIHENVRGAYARGNTLVSNCSFDRNETGLDVGADSGKELTIKDCLFTHNSAQGILINSGAGEVVNDYNGFYGNTQDISGGTWGPDSWSDKEDAPNPLTQSPYYSGIETGWQLHYRLNQSSPLVDAGSRTSIEASLDIFTTSADGRPDTGPPWQDPQDVWRPNKVDTGYHFPIGGSEGILHQGYRQTDIALRWNDMTDGCLRAFSFDGDARDEMGIADGKASEVYYIHGRYNGWRDRDNSRNLKYDYSMCADFYRALSGGARALSDVKVGNRADIGNMSSGTVCAWILPRTMADGTPTIYYKGANGGGPAKWFYLSEPSPDGKEVRLCARVECTGGAATAKSVYFAPDDRRRLTFNGWHHVGMAWAQNAGATVITLYTNGKKLLDDPQNHDYSEHYTGSGTPAQDSNCDAYVGASMDGSEGNHFDGYIADVFVYNRPLEDDEFRWLALNGDYDETDLKDEWVVIPNFGAMGEYENFPLGQFNAATWAASDQEGENKWIWVSEFYVPRVTKISPTGVILKGIGGKKFDVGVTDPVLEGPDRRFYGPWGIDVDESHYLYVADSANERIQVFDQNGNFVAKWGSQGYDETPVGRPDQEIRFLGPRFLAAQEREGEDPGAFVYVSDYGSYAGQTHARVLKFEFWYNPGHSPRVECVGAWGEWAPEPPGEQTRPDDRFYDLRGIELDSDGDVWVCDRGPAGNVSFLKEFSATGTFKTKFSAVSGACDYCSGLGILRGSPDYIYSSGGEMVHSDHIAKFTTAGTRVASFDYFGPVPGHSYACWGGFPTPWGTILSTDWFGGKAQEWQADGTHLQTFQSSLRSDAYSIKCRNHTKYIDKTQQLHPGQDKQVWQGVTLSQHGTYWLQFLGYTNGEPVGMADVLPYASYTGQPGNRVFSVSWENYVITDVDIPGEADCHAAYVWGRFTVPADQTLLPWDIGVEVKVNEDPNVPRLVYIASLSCRRE